MEIDGEKLFPQGPHPMMEVKPWQKRLGEITDPLELREWAIVHVQSAIAEHPNDEDRANALLGLGILLTGRAP